jgi:secondary thiamine-phosphate synthase enzyme
MQPLTIKTSKKREIIDITGKVGDLLPESSGVCFVHVQHTTAAITTADLDPGTDLDMLDAFEAMMPKLKYRHPHNPAHVPDHILSSMIGTAASVPVANGNLVLGTWQRVILVELDGPRERNLTVSVAAVFRFPTCGVANQLTAIRRLGSDSSALTISLYLAANFSIVTRRWESLKQLNSYKLVARN